MRKGILLLVLVTLVFNLNAQEPDPRLFSTWYILEYIEDGVSYLSPDNYPIEIFEEGTQDCAYRFHFPNPWSGGFDCIGSITENHFVIQELGILTEGEICQDGPPECEVFFSKYYPLYGDTVISGDPLSYMIEELQNNRSRLVVTNLAGDQAIYSNQYLSVNDHTRPKAVVYPNPVIDELFVASDLQIEKVRVYSLQGHLIFETSSSGIDFSVLHRGLYFIEIDYDTVKEIYKIIKR